MLPTLTLTSPVQDSDEETLTRNQAARLLGLSPNTVSKLLASRFLPDLQIWKVLALSRHPQVTVACGVLPVLRTGPAAHVTRAEDEAPVLQGDGVGLNDEQFLDANRMWWRCDPEAVTEAGLLPVAVAGFVTGVLAIRGIEESRRFAPGEVRHAFTATVAGRVGVLHDPATYRVLGSDSQTAQLTAQLLGSRVTAAVSGGPIAYLVAEVNREPIYGPPSGH
ncbi:helix-turn-helix domain-containing protein [Streptacidiphilus sp. EB103A]|uniref:helix-turn-helix domain-containing protein n=1 Tax=Streptacidiphilus sp. EB103A TaxID=3156275 RepID=UPI003514B86D